MLTYDVVYDTCSCEMMSPACEPLFPNEACANTLQHGQADERRGKKSTGRMKTVDFALLNECPADGEARWDTKV